MMNNFENLVDIFDDLMDTYAQIELYENDLDEDFEAMAYGDDFPEYDDFDDVGEMYPCDYSGFCGGTPCSRFFQCKGKTR